MVAAECSRTRGKSRFARKKSLVENRLYEQFGWRTDLLQAKSSSSNSRYTVQAMFHQVKVQPSDCDALRFLCWDPEDEDLHVDYRMLVHIFGAKSSPCCANKALLQAELDWTVNSVTFWADSTTVLQYIYNETQRFHHFVASRLDEFYQHTKPNQWRHVSGQLNPAHDGSRGLFIEVFKSNCHWLLGPDFLHQSTDEWPSTKIEKSPMTTSKS